MNPIKKEFEPIQREADLDKVLEKQIKELDLTVTRVSQQELVTPPPTPSSDLLHKKTTSPLAQSEDPTVSAVGQEKIHKKRNPLDPHLDRFESFQKAMRSGNKDQIEELLKQGVSPNQPIDREGHTPLMLLANCSPLNQNEKEILQLLLDYHADVEIQDKKGVNAFHYAIKKGNKDFFKELLAKEIYPDKIDDIGHSALMLLAFRPSLTENHKEIVRLLLTHKPDTVLLEKLDKTHHNALHYAVSKSNLDFIQELLKHEVTIGIPNKDHQTVLMLLANRSPLSDKDKEILKLLLNYQKDSSLQELDDQDHLGETALYHAVSISNFEFVQEILKYNVNINLPNHKGYTPLMLLASQRPLNETQKKIFKLLIDHPKININHQAKDGNTALHLAVLKNNAEFIQLLYKNKKIWEKIDLRLRNKKDFTAYLYANAKNYDPRLIELLMPAKAAASSILFFKSKVLGQFCGIKKWEKFFPQAICKTYGEALQHKWITPLPSDAQENQRLEWLKLKSLREKDPVRTSHEALLKEVGLDQEKNEIRIQALKDASNPSPSPSEICAKIKKGELVILPAGSSGHSANLVFYKSFMVFCNRGVGNKKGGSTMKFVPIDPEKFNEDIYKEIRSYKKSKWTDGAHTDFFYKKLPEKLKPSEKDKVRLAPQAAKLEKAFKSHKEQRAGTCTAASLKLANRACIALQVFEKEELFEDETFKPLAHLVKQCSKCESYLIRQYAEDDCRLALADMRLAKKNPMVAASHQLLGESLIKRLHMFTQYHLAESSPIPPSTIIEILEKEKFRLDVETRLALAKLAGTSLTKLDLQNTDVTDEQLEELFKACPHITDLNLSLCDKITDSLISKLPQTLVSLNLYECHKLTDAGIKDLPASLESIDLSYCFRLTPDILPKLPTSLKSFKIYGCDKLIDALQTKAVELDKRIEVLM